MTGYEGQQRGFGQGADTYLLVRRPVAVYLRQGSSGSKRQSEGPVLYPASKVQPILRFIGEIRAICGLSLICRPVSHRIEGDIPSFRQALCQGMESLFFLLWKFGLNALESISTKFFESGDRSNPQKLEIMRRGIEFFVNHLGLRGIKIQIANPLALQSLGDLIGISRELRGKMKSLFQPMAYVKVTSCDPEKRPSNKEEAENDDQT
jgi:hypothetical protein